MRNTIAFLMYLPTVAVTVGRIQISERCLRKIPCHLHKYEWPAHNILSQKYIFMSSYSTIPCTNFLRFVI